MSARSVKSAVCNLLGLGGLGAEVLRGTSLLEVTGKDRLQEGVENDLGTAAEQSQRLHHRRSLESTHLV